MRTTLDLPRELVEEAMELTRCKTKTELIADDRLVTNELILAELIPFENDKHFAPMAELFGLRLLRSNSEVR